MSHFPLERLNEQETPFYYYDMSLLRRTLAAVKQHAPQGSEVHYALKANSNPLLLQVIAEQGLGADCVSGGEIARAIEAGIAPAKIVYSGVGKTDREIRQALQAGIACFNVESVAELDVIDMIAADCGVIAPIALRVNPHVDAHTHHYITTGMSENKFGIDLSMLDDAVTHALSLSHVRMRGLHFHIGSQIVAMQPFEVLCEVVNKLSSDLEQRGVAIDYINVGGGLGVDYSNPDVQSIPDFATYFSLFARNIKLPQGATLHFELGRSIVCQCGSLITRVLYVKQGLNKQFVIVDAGMTDLIRQALYQSEHRIENITSHEAPATYDVVGPICESSDSFGSDIVLPATRRGDLLAIRSAGAYGEAMAMQYNGRSLPSSLCVE